MVKAAQGMWAGSRRTRTITGGVALLWAFAALLLWAPGAMAATVIEYTLDKDTVVYGQALTLNGKIDPVAADQQIVVAVDGADVATVATAADGTFTYTFTPKTGGQLTARVAADGSVGAALPFGVQPRLVTKVTKAQAYFRATMIVYTSPRVYAGRVEAVVTHNGEEVGNAHTWVKNGKARLNLPSPGTGRFKVDITISGTGGFTERAVARSFKTYYRTLKVGSHGPDVRLLLRQLSALRIRIPGVATTLSQNAADSIMAFQKAYGLPRTYVFDRDDWNKLDKAKLLKPRYAEPALHIEINKTKQILTVVKNGEPWAIIACSTGATGNTPEGTHSIIWKAYSAPTPYGGLLYWDMEFHPSFAMHAYSFVPPYPASHGCVRQPNWVAPWTYSVSSVGETVYVFR
jgi:hypothetical protein